MRLNNRMIGNFITFQYLTLNKYVIWSLTNIIIIRPVTSFLSFNEMEIYPSQILLRHLHQRTILALEGVEAASISTTTLSCTAWLNHIQFRSIIVILFIEIFLWYIQQPVIFFRNLVSGISYLMPFSQSSSLLTYSISQLLARLLTYHLYCVSYSCAWLCLSYN